MPEWKRDGIDRMLAAARTLAADTNPAILSKNQTGPGLLMLNAEYKRLVTAMYEHAQALVTSSDAAGS